MKKKYILELYVALESYLSDRAKYNLEAVLRLLQPENYDLKVFDITGQPGLCDEKRIIAVPLLIKTMPLPEERCIGILDQKILGRMLGVPEKFFLEAPLKEVVVEKVNKVSRMSPVSQGSQLMRDVIVKRGRNRKNSK